MRRKLAWLAGLGDRRGGVDSGRLANRAKPRAHVAITISKETTYITGPLRKDGYVDYVAALEPAFPSGRHAGEQRGRALPEGHGPGEIDPKYRDEYCRMLGIPPLPEKGRLLRHARQVREAIEGRGEARRRGRRE